MIYFRVYVRGNIVFKGSLYKLLVKYKNFREDISDLVDSVIGTDIVEDYTDYCRRTGIYNLESWKENKYMVRKMEK